MPPNPSELLSSERMLEGLDELKKQFDIILFDSTPCMLVTDALIISRIVDATIIVSSHKKTKIEDLKTVQKNIENVGGKIAGVIINKIPVSLQKYKSKYYYYGNNEKTRENKESMESIKEKNYETKEEESVENDEIKSNKTIIDQIDKYLEENKE